MCSYDQYKALCEFGHRNKKKSFKLLVAFVDLAYLSTDISIVNIEAAPDNPSFLIISLKLTWQKQKQELKIKANHNLCNIFLKFHR